MNRRSALAVASAIYDGLVAVMLVAGRPLMAQIFNVPLPQPPIHADLNGLFLFAVAAGYVIPYREPDSIAGRTYLWVMGPLLKGAGALTFIADYVVRHSPASFLLFAVSDGVMALLTLWALVTDARPSPSRYADGVSVGRRS
ncbi:MAG TPA: hypothetical protein VKD69_09940 [Vicinamibacterales bacterium]|nr:hypothetical protein [Vicinamibacterales bacterium]